MHLDVLSEHMPKRDIIFKGEYSWDWNITVGAG